MDVAVAVIAVFHSRVVLPLLSLAAVAVTAREADMAGPEGEQLDRTVLPAQMGRAG